MSPRLELRAWSRPLLTPHVTARTSRSTRRGWWVRLSDGEQEGWGEAACWPGFGAGLRATRQALRAAAADPRLPERLSAAAGDEPGLTAVLEQIGAPEARAALSCAALDLAARRADRPLAAWLTAPGTTAAPSVAVHALVRDAAQARAAVAAGAGTLKLKVGHEPALAERARLAAVREAVGPAVRLRLDANGAWTVSQARERLRGLAPLGIDLLEQPLPAGDLDGLRALADCGVPLAVDEGLRDAADLEALLDARLPVRAVVLKPLFLGGLLPARALARRALGAGLRVIVTHGLEGAVGRAAALALAAAVPARDEAHGLGPVLRQDALQPGGGRLRVPAAPGLAASPWGGEPCPSGSTNRSAERGGA